jgi:hypothetical protein
MVLMFKIALAIETIIKGRTTIFKAFKKSSPIKAVFKESSGQNPPAKKPPTTPMAM